MAVDFNATTSKAEHTTASISISNLITICAWCFADGIGETAGRVFHLDEAGNSFRLFHDTVGNQMKFASFRVTLPAQYTFPFTDGVWQAVALSYDATTVPTLPVVRVNFASVTATQTDAGSGAQTMSNTGYCIGNASASDRTWDGMLQHVQLFDRILTAQECDDALKRPGSVTSGMRLWIPLRTATDVNDLSGNGFNATATALTDRDPNAPIGLSTKMQHYA